MSAARRRSREFALQGLYQWQYTGTTASQVLKNLSEMQGFSKADHAFLEAELKGAPTCASRRCG
jgi:N utilization substance protein B